MAEKSESLQTPEDKVTEAKELFSRGSRNYLLKGYRDAAEDLSQACEVFGAIYGDKADELGMPYLMYAKSLVALAQNEGKVIEVPEEEDDDDEEDAENNDEEEGKTENGDEPDVKEGEEEEKTEDVKVNGDAQEEDKPKEEDSNGPSTSDKTEQGASNGHSKEGEDDDDVNKEEEEEPVDLMLAWEVLELAAQIFERQGESQLANLAEVYSELAGISIENSNFEEAIFDYKRALDIQMKVPDNNRRIIAEIHYKIGLALMMLRKFDESVDEMQKASELIDQEINDEKAKDDQSDKTKELVKDLEEAKQDILAKIAEIAETKQQSIDIIKKELSNVLSAQPAAFDGAGPSSSATPSSAERSRPNDISHLIKRKKPEGASSDVEASPAKKPAL